MNQAATAEPHDLLSDLIDGFPALLEVWAATGDPEVVTAPIADLE